MKQITTTLLVGFGSFLVGLGIGCLLSDDFSDEYIFEEDEEFEFDHKYTAEELAEIYEDQNEIKETLIKYEEENRIIAQEELEESIHVVDHNEFFTNPEEYSQSTLVFYEKDGVVSDSYDEVVVDYEKLIGDDFADHFGDQSEDPNVVYIQNDKMKTMYEVIRDESSYSETVLGFKDEDEDDYKKALKYFKLEEDREE